MGLTINEYDNCVATKTVNGKQLTVVWYVDDLKISHVDEEVVEDIVKTNRGLFRKNDFDEG